MEKIYLVTGAAGFLGNNVIKMLVNKNIKVRALVFPNDPNVKYLPKDIELFYGNVTDRNSLFAFFDTPKSKEVIVIHCAGIVTIASRYDEKVYNVNVNGTKNIVDICLEKKVSKMVHVSSVHAIPELENGQTIKEIDHFDPDKVIGLYAKTKAEASQYVLDAAEKGLNVSIVHPSGIIGPNDYGRSHLTQLMVDFCNGRLTAGVKGGYDFVDVRDVANGIYLCSIKGEKGRCYLLTNNYYSVKDMINIFHVVTGKRALRTYLPIWFAKLTSPLAELYYKILHQPPLYTRYSLYTLYSNSTFSNEYAKEKLGYTTRSMEETIKDMYIFLKEQKRIK